MIIYRTVYFADAIILEKGMVQMDPAKTKGSQTGHDHKQ